MKRKKIIMETIIIIYIVVLSFLFFNLPNRIELYGNYYLSNTDKIDLSDNIIANVKDLDILNKFKRLKEIDLGNNIITNDQFVLLTKKHPNVTFKAVTTYNVYGVDIRDDENTIKLTNVLVDDNLESKLSVFKNLKKVDLSNQDLSLEKEINLEKKFPNVEFEWEVPILDKKVPNNIETLNLDGLVVNNINDFSKSLSLLHNLTYLDMGNSNLSNEQLQSLREKHPNIKIAWIIKFGVWQIKTDDIAFSVLISNFPYVRLTSDDLSFLKYCTDLQALDLGHQNITDLNVIADNVPNLRILILADNKITDISPLKKLKHLHYLELFINKISDFSPIEDMKELVDLNICYNKVNDIEPFKRLPKLERLWVVGCGINNLKELNMIYPNATINNKSGFGSTGSGWRTHERYYSMIDMYHKRNYISYDFTKYD